MQHANRSPGIYGQILALIKRYRALLLYGFIGGGAVIIDVGMFWIIDHVTALHVAVNNALSIFVAMVYSFLMNAHFNFKTRTNLLPRFFSFAGVTTVGFLISTLLIWALIAVHVPSTVAKVLTLPAVFITQFFLNSRLTFRSAKSTSENIALESIN